MSRPSVRRRRGRSSTAIALLLAFVVLLGGGLTVQPAAAATGAPAGDGGDRQVSATRFHDVPADHTFVEEIEWAAGEGIAQGFPDGRFGPELAVSRQAAAAFLARFAAPDGAPPACTTAPFVDVGADHPFCAEIAWLAGEGVIEGYLDGTFGPDRPVTRQAVAGLLTRMAGPRAVIPPCTVPPFHDVAADHVFCEEIAWMAAEGIARGYDDGSYQPALVVSRQGFAALLHRFAHRAEPTTPSEPTHTAGWRFVPETVLLAPGESTEVRLVHVDGTGTPTGAPAPALGALAVTTPDVATFEPLGEGRVRVVAGTTIDATVATATVPDADLAVPLAVTVADLADGVVAVDDASFAFPAAGAAGPSGSPWYRTVGVGPFSWSEISARISLPETGADGTVTWPGADGQARDLGASYPVVVVDTALGEGDKVIGTGGSGVLGIVRDVVERAFGGHTFRLATVEIADVFAFFDDVHVDIDYDQLLAVGAAPDFAADEEFDVLPDPEPEGRAPRSSTTAALRAAADEDAPQRCTSAHLQAMELKTTIQMGLTPSYRALVDVDGAKPIMQLEFGLKGRAAATVGLTGQLTAVLTADCEIWHGPVFKVPAPLPVGAFITGTVEQALNFVAELKASGGAKYEAKAFCEATVEMRGGFRYNGLTETFEDRNLFQRGLDCNAEKKVIEDDVPGLGTPVAVEGGIGVDITSPTGVQVGGAVVERIGKWFGRSGLGKAEFIESKISPRVKTVWENDATVVGALESGSKAGMEIGASIALKADPIDWLVSKIARREPGQNLSYTIAEIDPPLLLASFYRSLNKGELTFEVDGKERSQSPLVLADEQEVIITAKTVASATPNNADPPAVHGLDAWIRFSDDGEWERFTGLSYNGSSLTFDGVEVRGRFEVTPTLCQRISEDKPATVALLPQTHLFGILETSGFAGTFTLRCGEPELKFEESELEFTAAELRTPDGRHATLDLTLVDAETIDPDAQWTWTLESTTPDWLTVTPTRGDQILAGTASDGHVSEIRFDVDCKDHREEVVHVVEAQVDHDALDEPLSASLLVEADCSGIYVDWADGSGEPGGAQPGPFTAPVTTSVTVVTEGRRDATWTASAQSGSVSPASGTVPKDEKATFSVTVNVPDDREPACEITQPERTETVTIVVEDRGSVSLSVKFKEIPAKDPEDCEDGGGGDDDPGDPTPPEEPPPPPPCTGPGCTPKPPCPRCGPTGGGSQRDPHLVTMDGVGFSAQVLGEYTYLGPDPSHPGYDPEDPGPRVDARHELTAPGSSADIKPTSITAISVEAGGHRVEVYSRPGLALLIDGEERAIGAGLSERLAGDVQVTAVVSSYPSIPVRLYVEGPGIKVEAEIYSRSAETSLMNAWVWSINGDPQRGLLGSRDGDKANDLQGRDGTTFPVELIRQHRIDLYRLTDSWRITEPADSLFTRSYDGFADVNHEVDLDAVAAWIGQAEELLGRAGRVCSGVDDPRLAEMLAWELAIGTPEAELGDLVCTYRIGGEVVLEDAGHGYPLSGVEVRLTGPGLVDCTTLTSFSGSYSCQLHADVLTGEPGPPAPPTITAVAVWPGQPDRVLATGTVEFRGQAAAGRISNGTINLITDASAAPVIELSGSLTWGDVLQEDPYLVYLNAIDADGVYLPGSSGPRTVTPDADGRFTLRQLLPLGAVSVEVTYARFGEWLPVTEVLPLVGASPHDLTWDAEVRVVRLSGRQLHNDEPRGPAGLTTTVHPLDGSGQRVPDASWSVMTWFDAAGNYELELIVPAEIPGIEVDFATIGGVKTWRGDPLPAGSSTHEFDVVVTGTTVRFVTHAASPPSSIDVQAHLWTSGPPTEWERAPSVTWDPVETPEGRVFEGIVPVEAGVVSVSHWRGIDVVFTSHHLIDDPGGEVTIELPSVPPDGSEVWLSGRIWCTGCMWNASFFGTATVSVADPVTGEPGEVLAEGVVIAPDPTTGAYRLALGIPAGVESIHIRIEALPAHGGCFSVGANREEVVHDLDGGSVSVSVDVDGYQCI